MFAAHIKGFTPPFNNKLLVNLEDEFARAIACGITKSREIFFMAEIFFFGIIVAIMQLVCEYLLYLPFKPYMSAEKVTSLWKKFFIWFAVDTAINIFLLQSGINFSNYKFLFSFGWLPYFLILAFSLKNKFFHLIFALSMKSLWVFLLHSLSSAIILIKTPMTDKTLIYLAIIYLILFFALLPIEKKLFLNIFPSEELFTNKRLKYFISFFPFAIFIGTLIPIIEVTFLQTWQEKISRMVILIFFFMVYRSFEISMRKFEAEQREEKISRLEKQQILQLHGQNLLISERRKEIEKLRENLTEKYSIIEKFIEDEKISEAKKFISEQENLLEKTYIKRFCDAPLINAALSIYLYRAEEIGAKIKQKINLSKDFYTNEIDLAVLISNMLENAVQASAKQEKNRREISIILQQIGEQFILEISNRYDFKIKLGENDLPSTKKFGHGFGMYSLEKFAKKYDAYVNFSHKNNLVTFQIYWDNYL